MNKKINYIHTDITGKILQAFFEVSKFLPHGLYQHIYIRALKIEFDKLGLKSQLNKEYSIVYKEEEIGAFHCDMLVNDVVFLKIISDNKITLEHEYVMKQYLRLCDIEVALILSFMLDGDYKRIVFTNDYKKNKIN